jgi:hypothetical protein
MSIFNTWIDLQQETSGGKTLHICTEVAGERANIADELQEIMRSHYNDLSVIADDIQTLGYETAAAILKERLPQGKKSRSGDLGEILATEYIEHALGYEVPVRRLRYKDGREMALRGDDFIGMRHDAANGLSLLKGESKSAAVLSNATVKSARSALDRDSGRCTPHALLFIVDRLLESAPERRALGMAIKLEVAKWGLPPASIAHAFFTLTGNSPLNFLRNDLLAADTSRPQTSVNINITDHQDFIAGSYKDLEDLGNS